MITSRRPGTVAGVRLLLLTVLLGLFAMHVMTAHGGDHHGVAAPAAHLGTGHDGTVPAPIARDGEPAAMAHQGAGGVIQPGLTEPAPPAAAVPAAATVLVGAMATASAAAERTGIGLALCWLLLTAGAALLALLLRAIRLVRRRVPPVGAPSATGPSRPRAPPGRMRLHELMVLRV